MWDIFALGDLSTFVWSGGLEMGCSELEMECSSIRGLVGYVDVCLLT